MPCPISGFLEMIVTRLSGVIRMKTLSAKSAGGSEPVIPPASAAFTE